MEMSVDTDDSVVISARATEMNVNTSTTSYGKFIQKYMNLYFVEKCEFKSSFLHQSINRFLMLFSK